MCDFDAQNIRKLFPYLIAKKNKGVVYFDNAATTHKPGSVINRILEFYSAENCNIHRSSHKAGAFVTEEYEAARALVRDFLSAKNTKEIIFTSGATESVNLVAHSYGLNSVSEGDIVLVSPIEHHSNLIPWQVLAKEKKAIIQEVPVNENFVVDLEKLQSILSGRVKLIAINHVSNVTGIVQDVKAIVSAAKRFNIPVFVDGAQAVPHINVDVAELGCDFYCFSGHKVFGPTGTGVLFVKTDYLDGLNPYKTGGQMVSTVSFNHSEWGESPLKFEAGTPNIAGVMGLGESIKFINAVGMKNISIYETELASYMDEQIRKIPHLTLYGGTLRSMPVFSFNVNGLHHYDIATLLSEKNIFVRAGHLCNQSLMSCLNIDGCVRASLSFYNTQKEIDLFIDALKRVLKFLIR
tara:strand:+ start:374 stop:1597 length:1224 start_codon:yes stop_codon:yes gene_type:complete